MTAPVKPWEVPGNLQNATQILRNSTGGQLPGRAAPVLPPRPSAVASGSSYNSYMPFSGFGSGYGGFGSYGSYGSPYRSSMYGYGSGYGGYNNYGSYGMYGMGTGYPSFGQDDHERRFIQYAEESSRNTFASVESIVRAFNSLAMMLDNTFFAMTSSFRAVLSVAENFGRLRTMFGHIWYSVNIFRIFNWAYRKLREMLGLKVKSTASTIAWKEAKGVPGAPGGTNWPTLAFLGVLISAPYIISKFLPKYIDKSDPSNWQNPGVRAKAVFDFVATSPNELTIQTNDIVTLAPTHVQEEMKLKNTGWAFAVLNGKSGVVPLNYLVISKQKPLENLDVPVPRIFNNNSRTEGSNKHTKRVSFGENQIFENVDIDDYFIKDTSHIAEDRKAVGQGRFEANNNSIDQKQTETSSNSD